MTKSVRPLKSGVSEKTYMSPSNDKRHLSEMKLCTSKYVHVNAI